MLSGQGSSGSDIAGEVGGTADLVEISAKSGVWFVPHFANGRPLDNNLTRFSGLLPGEIRKKFFQKVALTAYKNMGFDEEKLTDLALPDFDPALTRVTPGTIILERIRDGRVRVKGDIQHIEPNGVRYIDGSFSEADTLDFLHWLCPRAALHGANHHPVTGRQYYRPLYKHVFHPELDNIAFLAQCRVGGPVFPVMEMQARWTAAVFTGQVDHTLNPSIRKEVNRRPFRSLSPKWQKSNAGALWAIHE